MLRIVVSRYDCHTHIERKLPVLFAISRRFIVFFSRDVFAYCLLKSIRYYLAAENKQIAEEWMERIKEVFTLNSVIFTLINVFSTKCIYIPYSYMFSFFFF